MTSATIDLMYQMPRRILTREECFYELPGMEVVYDFEVREPLRSFLGGDRFRMYIQLSGRTYDPLIQVVFDSYVPCRDTGHPINVQHMHTLSPNVVYDREMVMRAVRAFLGSVLLHELDEALWVDGVRKWDPHRGDGPHLHGGD